MVIVTSVGSWSAGAAWSKALRDRRCHERSDGTFGFALRYFPVKTIVLSFITEDFLGVLDCFVWQ